MQTMNFRVKYRRTHSKIENLSRSVALTQFVKYISDETPQNHSKIPQSTRKLCHYSTKSFSKTACETHTYTILWKSAINSSILGL